MVTNISKITIDARPQKVWNALTLPELVKQWQYGSELTTDWQPGSPIRFTAKWQDQVFEQWGTVLEMQPYRQIVYNLFAPRPGLEDRPEHYFTMYYLLTENNGKTELEIRQLDNRPGARQEPPQGDENPVLQALKKIAELNETGVPPVIAETDNEI
ncbi:SRPBCC domain-containing protein [Niabella sp. CC-SYL272]|uniref:SRPBCC family protein n=1 Tax=Niabella agricola TaxID=2891571 RepID=UPI001F3A7FAA|nr:SRPBCC family protein [Niabella agricola]MCF3107584.1 SRPBCC domain-containing protein [Niabella agricola]